MSKAQFRIGTSGFSIQNFYPKEIKSNQKLAFYSGVFSIVEINSTFYHIPRPATIQNWLTSITSDFVFSFKVFRGFTHFKEGNLHKDKLTEWFKIFKPFERSEQKHLMLFQFPASFTFSEEKFINLLTNLPRSFLFAFEFRHTSWFNTEVYKKLQLEGHGLVLSDGLIKKDGQQVWPKFDLEADFSYIRFHGSSKLYASSYSGEELQNYAKIIRKKISAGRNVYCFFNNDARGFAAENARLLIKLLKEN